MKRASYIFLIVLMLAACGGWRDGQRLLDRADSLLYGQPDSALRLLDSITEDTTCCAQTRRTSASCRSPPTAS